MEMGERVLEGGHWNPGIVPSTSVPQPPSQPEVWPLPSECLMNGMLPPTSSTDAHVAMFGNSLVISPQFRHRFPHPSLHYPNVPNATSVIGIGGHHDHHNTLNLSIPTHPLVESNDAEVVSAVQDAHSSLENRLQVLDDCSDECSDDEEDEEESEDDIHMEESRYVHSHEPSMSHPALAVEEDSLPSCQQHHQLTVINVNGDVNLMGGMEDSSCHQKGSMMSHVHEIETDMPMPTISQGHPLNSNPISAIPMITGNCNSLMISDDTEDVGVGNSAPPESEDPSTMNMNMNHNQDPNGNSGQSVHGKMYVDERVVFHLKQWTDSGFGNFNSCREQDQHKNYRCAVCHLRSPNNGLQQKDAHRHPVRGILFTFEDCIIVELYPEHYITETDPQSDIGPETDPKQTLQMESGKADHSMTMNSYLNPSVPNMSNLVITSNTALEVEKSTQGTDHDQSQSWWDDFDAGRQEAERDRHHPHHSSDQCVINLKLNAQNFHDAQAEAEQIQEMHNDTVQLNEQSIQEVEPNMDVSLNIKGYQFHKYKSNTKYEEASLVEVEVEYIPESNSNDQINSGHCVSNLTALTEMENEGGEQSMENHSDLPLPIDDLESNPEIPTNSKNMKIGNKIPQKTEKVKLKELEKYRCPSCKKSFNLKRQLKHHLDEKHYEGNPFQCTLCKMQYADAKRFQKHSCTLGVETIKSQLKLAESKDNGNVHETDPPDSNSLDNLQTVINNRDLNSSKDGDNDEINGRKSFNKTPRVVNLLSVSNSNSSRKATNKSDTKGRLKLRGTGKKTSDSEEAKNDISKNKMKSSTKKISIGSHSHQPKEKESDEDTENELEDDYEPQVEYVVTKNHSQGENRSLKKDLKTLKEKGFECNICGKCFTVERRLLNHIACHRPERERSSQCDQCGKRFARKDKLLRHMYVHSNEKLFVCEICEKRFSRRDKLSDHLKSHQTDEIHNCPMCEKQFLRPDILKQHVKLHRMGNKHQCPECLRFVTGKERLAQHMKRHEEAKALGQTLLCPLCTKYFIQRQSLKAHIKKFHPDALSQLNLNQLDTDGGINVKESAYLDRNCESPSSSNSNGSTFTPEIGEPSHQTRSTSTPTPATTTVCLVLENVMGSSKPKPSPANKDLPKPFSCQQCDHTFSRKQALKKHVVIKHSNSSSNKSTSKHKTEKSHSASRKSSRIVSPTNPKVKRESRNMSHCDKDQDRESPKSLEIDNEQNKLQMTLSHAKYRSHASPPSPNSSATSSPPILIPLSNAVTVTQNQHIQHLPSLQPLQLPSCSSLTNDLSFNLNLNQSSNQHQQAHLNLNNLNAYSHHFALSMAGRSINIQNIHNPCLMSTTTTAIESVVGHHLQHPQLNSIHLMNPHPHSHVSMAPHSQTNALMCQNSSYVINYPPTLPYHDQ